MELEISAGPSMTWVWAPDVDEAVRVREALDRAGRRTHQQEAGARVLGVGFGMEALTTLRALAEGGYTFRWHSSQPLFQQTDAKFGVPIGISLAPDYRLDSLTTNRVDGGQADLGAPDELGDRRRGRDPDARGDAVQAG